MALKFKLSPPKTEKTQGSLTVQSKFTKANKEVVHDDQVEEALEIGEFPPNCPRVGARVALKLSANFNSIEVAAWIELPVREFTAEAVQATHERAFEICEDRAVQKAGDLREVLKELV